MLFNLNNFASLKVISKRLKDSNIFFVHVLMKDRIKRYDSCSLAKPALSNGKKKFPLPGYSKIFVSSLLQVKPFTRRPQKRRLPAAVP